MKLILLKTLARALRLKLLPAAATWQWGKDGDRCRWGIAADDGGANPRFWVRSGGGYNDGQLMVITRKGVWMSDW